MALYQRSPRRNDSPYDSAHLIDSPQRSPRRPPPSSPSRSLFGLEKSVPPKPSWEQLQDRSWDSTPVGSSTDVNKPLPHSPTRSWTSSVYSGGSGYTKIIESYDRTNDELPPMPDVLQPAAYRDPVAPLLNDHNEVRWYADMPKMDERGLRTSQWIPTLQYALFRDKKWNTSAHELSHASTFNDFRNQTHDPVSPISSSSWQNGGSYGFLSPTIVSPPLVHPDYHLSYDYGRHYLPGPMCASVTRIVDPHLMPQPLRMSKTASMFFDSSKNNQAPSESSVKHVELLDIKEAQRRAAAAKQTDLEARAAELVDLRSHQRENKFIDIKEAQSRALLNSPRSSEPYEEQSGLRSQSNNSDSFVIYTGLRESVKAMMKKKLKQKRESREIEKAVKVQERERKRVLRHAEEKYPAMKNSPGSSTEQREYNWTVGSSSSGGRNSLMDGVAKLFRNLSVSKTQRTEEETRGRGIERGRRPKQLAVPLSPYQKYGTEAWYAKNKKKKAKAKAKAKGSGGIQLAATTKQVTTNQRFVSRADIKGLKKKTSEDLKEAYSQGRYELINALHVGRAAGRRIKDEDLGG